MNGVDIKAPCLALPASESRSSRPVMLTTTLLLTDSSKKQVLWLAEL